MIARAHIVFKSHCPPCWLVALSIRPRRSIEAETLFLWRQLTLCKERGIKPRRIDAATRISLVLLSRGFDWRSALIVVRPETLIRWHRAGWRLRWRWKWRPGHPILLEPRQLIRRMAMGNPLRGKSASPMSCCSSLGCGSRRVTVRKYMPKRPLGCPRGDQRWLTFVRNHAKAVIACDFFVTVIATFRLLYAFVVICSRRLVHFNVAEHPTSAWTLQQLPKAVG